MREKLIDMIIDAKRTDPEVSSFTEYLADYLLSHGVTIVENHVGETVFALYDVSEYKTKGGETKKRFAQIETMLHLLNAKEYGVVEIHEKKCTKTDSNRLAKIVFKTREEAEEAVRNCRKEKK